MASVSRAIARNTKNCILDDFPPNISDEELSLHSSSILDIQLPRFIQEQNAVSNHITSCIFHRIALPTILTPVDLWSRPVVAACVSNMANNKNLIVTLHLVCCLWNHRQNEHYRFFGRPGLLDGWLCCSRARVMSGLIHVRQHQTNESEYVISTINKYMLGSRYP